jgi:hypothetical protein
VYRANGAVALVDHRGRIEETGADQDDITRLHAFDERLGGKIGKRFSVEAPRGVIEFQSEVLVG